MSDYYNHFAPYLPPASRVLGIKVDAERRMAAAYRAGFSGCFLTKTGEPWMMKIAQDDRDCLREQSSLPWRVSEAIPQSFQGKGEGQRCCNWNFILAINGKSLSGSQDYGNCTSWATREGLEQLTGVQIALSGNLYNYPGRAGTAITYGNRGTSGQGMSLARAMWSIQNDGWNFEIVYLDGRYDLREENTDEYYGNKWGRSGPPSDLVQVTREMKIAHVAEVGSLEEARDALFGGASVIHGSNLTGTTKGTLISSLTSIGGHAQALLGYDDTDEFREWYERTTGKKAEGAAWINDQSWGDSWNAFPIELWPTHLWGVRPPGAWVLWSGDQNKVIRQWGDCYAFSDVKGLVHDGIPDWKEAFVSWA
jgi:hypothetical protein